MDLLKATIKAKIKDEFVNYKTPSVGQDYKVTELLYSSYNLKQMMETSFLIIETKLHQAIIRDNEINITDLIHEVCWDVNQREYKRTENNIKG